MSTMQIVVCLAVVCFAVDYTVNRVLVEIKGLRLELQDALHEINELRKVVDSVVYDDALVPQFARGMELAKERERYTAIAMAKLGDRLVAIIEGNGQEDEQCAGRGNEGVR